MASLDKRNGEWCVRWRDPDGKARSRQCPTRPPPRRSSARSKTPSPSDGDGSLATLVRKLGLDLWLRYLEKVHGKGAPLPPSVLTRRMLSDWYGDLRHGGLHGRDRSDATRRKIVEVGQLAWKWMYDNDESGAEIPAPRTLRMAREAARPTVAPTWAEMDTVIGALDSWHRRLAIALRFTGLRCQQAMGLRSADVDLARARLTIRGELGKSKQEQRGRIMPLVAILRRWEREDEWMITSNRAKVRERMARARDLERGWERSGVRKEAWEGRPHHAFRKGFVSELKRAGADADAVEFLVGHSLGLRGVSIDPDALPLADAIGRIPDVPRFDGDLGDGPWRLVTFDESERNPGFAPRPRRDRVCPERVPAGHRVRGNVLSSDAFRKNGGGGGSRREYATGDPAREWSRDQRFLRARC